MVTDDVIERLVDVAVSRLHHDASLGEKERQHGVEVLWREFPKILKPQKSRKSARKS
jgi:hypothetical protein